jgi:hypothetical protein
VSHPRQVVNGFTRRKPRHVRQTRSFSLAALGMLILSHIAGAQPLGINPSAAPSDLGNPSSINPAARASDVWNPSAINPAAAASQIPQPSGILGGAGRQAPGPRQITPLSRVPTLDGTPRSGITARQLEERRKRETEPGWSKRASVDRRHLAGAPGSLGDVLERPGRDRRILRRAAVHDQRGRRASRPTHDYGNERSPEGYVVQIPGDRARGPAEVLACAPNTGIRGHLA